MVDLNVVKYIVLGRVLRYILDVNYNDKYVLVLGLGLFFYNMCGFFDSLVLVNKKVGDFN